MSPTPPAKCPRCGSGKVASILYDVGLGDRKLQADPRARRAVRARRAPTGNDPRWCCLNCGLEWGHPRGLSGAAAGTDDLA